MPFCSDWIGDPSETRRVEMELDINVGRAVCNIKCWLNDIVEKEIQYAYRSEIID